MIKQINENIANEKLINKNLINKKTGEKGYATNIYTQ